MKLQPKVRKSILVSTLFLCSLAPTVFAQSASFAQTALNFVPFIAQDVNDISLSAINIDAFVIDIGTGTRFSIINNSGIDGNYITATRPTVTQIYWDMNAPLVPTSTSFNAALSSPTVNFTSGGSPSNLPGGTNISFSADYRFSPINPQVKNGLDPSETGVFDFQGVSYSQVIAGLTNGSLRIGMHIQEVGINGTDSKSFVNQAIPEPSSIFLLFGTTLLGVLRRRR